MDQQFNTPPNPQPNKIPGPQPNQPHGSQFPQPNNFPGQFPQANQSHGSQFPQPNNFPGQFPQQYQQLNNLSGELPAHPSATTVLVLGILSWLFIPFTCFFAWYIGGKAKKEIEGGAPYRWSGEIVVGYWLGVVGSILSIISILFFLFFVGLVFYGIYSAGPM